MSSTNDTSSNVSNNPKQDDAPAHGDSPAAPPATVTKTVETVEVRESPGQERVLKPTKVVHQIPADQAKDPAAKQD